MNKYILLLCVIVFSLTQSNAQAPPKGADLIDVNQSTYTQSFLSQDLLIQQVLIDSDCVTLGNFSSQVLGASGDITTKSYGYFNRATITTFPIEEGIVLTTGSAQNGGPVSFPPYNATTNTDIYPNVTNGLGGDTDLEAVTGQTGTTDATFIKFDVTPIMGVINFNYIFASEEYTGFAGCTTNSHDAVAFLIREKGTIPYTNMSLLPSGDYVGVQTVHNAVNQTTSVSCAINAASFEGYEVGDTNYGGRTKLLKATSKVTPGTVYEIKIVIADQGTTSGFDSAVFIEKATYEIDLGEDRTVAGNNAYCPTDTVTLDSKLASTVPHVWTYNGSILPTETSNSITVPNNKPGTYTVSATVSPKCEGADTIIVEFNPSEDAAFTMTATNDGGTAVITGNTGGTFAFNPVPTDTATINTSTGTVTNGVPGVTYTVEYTTGGKCPDKETRTVTVLSPINSATPPDNIVCDVDNDGFADFDLTQSNGMPLANVVTNNTAALHNVTVHETKKQAEDDVLPLGNTFTNTINGGQTVFVRIELKANNTVFVIEEWKLVVAPSPAFNDLEDNWNTCDTGVSDGFTEFNLTDTELVNDIVENLNPSLFTITYHTTEQDAIDNASRIAVPSNYANTTAFNQPIWVRVESSNNCFKIVKVNLEVDPLAVAEKAADLVLCDDNMEDDGDATNDGISFTLTDNDATVLGTGQNPLNFKVSYYETQPAAESGLATDALASPYTSTVATKQIFARVDNNTPKPIALDLTKVVAPGLDFNNDGVVDTYDQNNDGVFDLIDTNGDGISNGIDANMDNIFEGVDLDADGIADLVDLNGDNVIDNDASPCFAISTFNLVINPMPSFKLDSFYNICINTNGTEIIPNAVITPLNTPTGANYSYEWTQTINGVPVTVTSATFAPITGGTVSVEAIDNVTMCRSTAVTTLVNVGEPPVITSAKVITEAFADSHSIKVDIAPSSFDADYEFSINGGPFVQNTPSNNTYTFTNVSLGQNIVEIRDIKGCGLASVTLDVIDAPSFFTPNGDGYNDNWNIASLSTQPDAKIYIFNRLGKLLKQIGASGTGWDGTYNGEPVPSSDYWFTVEYKEPNTGATKLFKGHFTLKR